MLERLSNAFGPSGMEEEVKGIIYSEMSPLCDEIFEDNMGNLICHQKGKLVNNKCIMLSAHMDEVGFIIHFITDDGYLKFQTIGGIDPNVLISKKVIIGDNRVSGVIGTKPIHKSKGNDDKISVSDLYIDIGASSKEDALSYVDLGDYACFDSKFRYFGDGFIKGKALDDRVGCYSMIQIAKQNKTADIYYTFTVQEEIGCRGSKIPVKSIKPAYAIVIEGTTCSDVPGTDEFSFSTHIGNGPALSVRDSGAYTDIELTDRIKEYAEKNNIKCQYKQTTMGGNDASSIQLAGCGCKVVALSVPCRYIHSQSNVAKIEDIDNLIALLYGFIKNEVNK